MTRFLLSLSIGPVQEFIASARRTADLYAGSDLLTKVVGAAAATFTLPGDERIFPVSTTSGGANKILTVVQGDPALRAAQAKSAAREALQQAWTGVRDDLLERQPNLLNTRLADEQIDSFLELYAAWVPFPEGPQGYAQARQEVERLLAGRKALRDFKALPGNDAGLPKSPLDPSRACVLNLKNMRLPAAASEAPLQLKSTEYLDAVSVLKRASGRSLGQMKRGGVLSTRDLANRAVDPGAHSAGEDDDSEPRYPYYAVLIADGDRMGKLLSYCDEAREHIRISQELDTFAQEARTIVDSFDGQLVYAGGDDVMALMPVTTAVGCAQALARSFSARVGLDVPGGERLGTLSVGVAITHYREPLSHALQQARAAERAAKDGGRNRLAVALHTRGGSPMTVVQPWAHLNLIEWQAMYQGGLLPRGVAYELRNLALGWPEGDADLTGLVLRSEVIRILKRKSAREQGSKVDVKPLEDLLKEIAASETPGRALRETADQLVLARFLSAGALSTAEGPHA